MRFIITAVAATVLGGCTTHMGGAQSSLSGSCDAARVSGYVGRDGAAVAEEARIAAGARAVRVIGPDQAVTMDFRPDRLNLDTDAAGKVIAARCG